MIWLILCACSFQASAQTLSPQVISTAGAYFSNATGSLSFTIGEPNTATLVSSNHMLTQGFQQSFKLNLQVKALIEGYYISSGLMKNVLYNQGVLAVAGTECDTIEIQLRQSVFPFAMVYTSQQILQTDGQIQMTGLGQLGDMYYIVLKHRNAIETWSANPIMLSETTYYDFTTSASQAYGNQQIEVENGKWAMFSGDITQDENVDLLDAAIQENDINAFQFGYFATDINGDGNVDLLDVPILETNINSFVFSIHP